ncbi:hypothetical protein CAEBREN_18664 [Caenorhabditis brenneri]|uniref:Uncharacterized protein n=1 Tax=Caenorhabditis brenneri TaxID=135651 RepID=G0MJP7_CAEBE|nr:hypothetical protein CAEBREN_18664 [Caenorhabditis brenneri]
MEANTIESFEDQLKKFVVKQLEWERWREKNHEEMGKVFAIIGLVCLGLVVLVATPFLLHYLWLYWKSRRVGPATRVPKTPIDEKSLTESNSYRKDRDWKCLYDRASKGWNMCDGKVEKILKMMKAGKGSVPSKFTLKFWQWTRRSGTEMELNEVPPSYSSLLNA